MAYTTQTSVYQAVMGVEHDVYTSFLPESFIFLNFFFLFLFLFLSFLFLEPNRPGVLASQLLQNLFILYITSLFP
jgi:hypothetical protein